MAVKMSQFFFTASIGRELGMRREEEGIKRKSKKKKRRVDQLRGGEQERRFLASTIGYHLKKYSFTFLNNVASLQINKNKNASTQLTS